MNPKVHKSPFSCNGENKEDSVIIRYNSPRNNSTPSMRDPPSILGTTGLGYSGHF